MATLTPEQLKRLTRLMDERFVREMEEIEAVVTRARSERGQESLAGHPADLLDVALAEVAGDADAAVVRQDIEDVRDITMARRRLAAGTYGVCIDCGEPIAYPRLMAYPTAKRCITCQREHESEQAAHEGRRIP